MCVLQAVLEAGESQIEEAEAEIYTELPPVRQVCPSGTGHKG